jgi:SWI/SNF-related matrix-associated actin-dependent regulator 1 of chromatin subfamily A
MAGVPQYLVKPRLEGHVYGRVTFEAATDTYMIEAEPAVRELVKRVFPGSKTWRDGRLKFKATRRAVGDLNWVLLRFPMTVEGCKPRLEADRKRAIAHARRREENQAIAPIAAPAGFRGVLHPFQAEGVPYLVRNQRALLADDMGLGKTVQALAAYAEVTNYKLQMTNGEEGGGGAAVIVTPPGVLRQWERMIGVFLDFRLQNAECRMQGIDYEHDYEHEHDCRNGGAG